MPGANWAPSTATFRAPPSGAVDTPARQLERPIPGGLKPWLDIVASTTRELLYPFEGRTALAAGSFRLQPTDDEIGATLRAEFGF